jgi:multiple sugar transport system ATP-binding protein
MGVVPARLVAADGLAGFAVGDRTVPLWAPVPEGLRSWVDRDVVLGLRAEDVREAGGAQTVGLEGIAEIVEPLGPVTAVTVALAAAPVVAPGADLPVGPHARLRARFAAHSPVRPGDRVRVAVDATRAHVFDPVTGRALWHPPSDRPAPAPTRAPAAPEPPSGP